MFFNTLLADQAKWYPILFDSPMNAFRSVATWLTIALAIAFAVCFFVLKGETRTKFIKISLICAIAYAAVVGITLLGFTFAEDGIKIILFIPLLILIVAIAASAIVIAFKRNMFIYIAAGCIVGAALIASLVCMGVNFATGEPAIDNWLESNDDVNQIGLYIGAVLLVVAVIVTAFLTDRKSKNGYDSKSIAYAAVCIAMSFALSYLRIVKMPQGGSITIASLLPLMLYAFMFGPRKGVLAGAIFGMLQAVQDPVILHPAQFVLDYPAAFACIGLTGIFTNIKGLEKLPQIQFLLGGIIAGLSRFIMYYISGVFAFGTFAGEQSPWLYSFVYQCGYVLPDIAIAIVAGVLVLCSRNVARLVKNINLQNQKSAANQPAEETAVTQDNATEK